MAFDELLHRRARKCLLGRFVRDARHQQACSERVRKKEQRVDALGVRVKCNGVEIGQRAALT